MSKISLSEIIAQLQDLSKQAAVFNAELAIQIDQIILDLQKLENPSETDINLDRGHKIAGILSVVAKIIYDFCKDQ